MSSDDDDVIILTTTTSATTISRPLSRQPSNGSNKYNFNSTGFANAIGLSTKVGSVSTAVSRTTSTGSITNHVATSKGIARAATKVDIDLSTDEDELPAFLQLKPRAVDKGKGKAVDQVAAANVRTSHCGCMRRGAYPPLIVVYLGKRHGLGETSSSTTCRRRRSCCSSSAKASTSETSTRSE